MRPTTPIEGTDSRRVFLILVVLNVFWAPVNFVVRVATANGMTPAAVALLRWGSLAVLLFAILKAPDVLHSPRRPVWPNRGDAVRAILLGFFLLGPAHLCYYLGIQGTSTVEGTVFNTTSPLWTALLAFFILREKPTSRRVFAIGIGLVGAWLVGVGFRLPSLQAGHTMGNVVYMSAVIMETVVAVLGAKLVRRSSGMTVLSCQVLGAAAAQLLAPALLPQVFPLRFLSAGWEAWAGVAYLILIPSLLCWGTWYRMVERVPLSLMVVTLVVQPPIAALFGGLFLHERYGPNVVIGAAIILGALLVGASERPSDRVAVQEVADDQQNEHQGAPACEHV